MNLLSNHSLFEDWRQRYIQLFLHQSQINHHRNSECELLSFELLIVLLSWLTVLPHCTFSPNFMSSLKKCISIQILENMWHISDSWCQLVRRRFGWRHDPNQTVVAGTKSFVVSAWQTIRHTTNVIYLARDARYAGETSFCALQLSFDGMRSTLASQPSYACLQWTRGLIDCGWVDYC